MEITIENLAKFILSFFVNKIENYLIQNCSYKFMQIDQKKQFPDSLIKNIQKLAKQIFTDLANQINLETNNTIHNLSAIWDEEIFSDQKWQDLGAVRLEKSGQTVLYNSISQEVRNELFAKHDQLCFMTAYEELVALNRSIISDIEKDVSLYCTFGRIVGYLDSYFLRDFKRLYSCFPKLFNLKTLLFLQGICFELDSNIYIIISNYFMNSVDEQGSVALIKNIIQSFQIYYELDQNDLNELEFTEQEYGLPLFFKGFIDNLKMFFLTKNDAFSEAITKYAISAFAINFKDLFNKFVAIKPYDTSNDNKFYDNFYVELVDAVKSSLLKFLPAYFIYLPIEHKESQLNAYDYIIKIMELTYNPTLINDVTYSQFSMEDLLWQVCNFIDLTTDENEQVFYEEDVGEHDVVQSSNEHVEEMLSQLTGALNYLRLTNFCNNVIMCLEEIQLQYAQISLKILVNFFIKNVFAEDFMTNEHLLLFFRKDYLDDFQKKCIEFVASANNLVLQSKYNFMQINYIKEKFNLFLQEQDVNKQMYLMYRLLQTAVFMQNQEFMIQIGSFFMVYIRYVTKTDKMFNMFESFCGFNDNAQYLNFVNEKLIPVITNIFLDLNYLQKNPNIIDEIYDLISYFEYLYTSKIEEVEPSEVAGFICFMNTSFNINIIESSEKYFSGNQLCTGQKNLK